MFLYRGSSRGMGGSPEDLGLLAVAGPQTYCGTLGQPAVCSCCQSPHLARLAELVLLLLFTDGLADASGGGVTCPRSHTDKRGNLRFKSRSV